MPGPLLVTKLYIRTFVDKGRPLADLLRQVAAPVVALPYLGKLLAAFDAPVTVAQPLVDPLSDRTYAVG